MNKVRFMTNTVMIFINCFVISNCTINTGLDFKNQSQKDQVTSTPIATSTPVLTITPTYPCPLATQEQPPRVDPLISPTNETSQVIHIHGNFEEATVEVESGVFSSTATSNGLEVKIDLLPNTIHHLKVTARVAHSNYSGCTYGGYNMTVLADAQGQTLVIVQGVPATPSPVTDSINPASIDRIKLLSVISLTNEQRPESAIFTNSDQLISFGMGQGVRYWDTPSGEFNHELLFKQEWMTISAALSPDGKWLANGGAGYDPNDDNMTYVRVWDLSSNQPRLFGHHPHQVKSLSFSPDSTLLASGGDDNTIYIWDVITGNQLASFEAHTSVNDDIMLRLGVTQLAWVDNSSLLIHANGAVLLWKIPLGEQILTLDDRYQWMDFNQKTGWLALLRDGCVRLTTIPGNQLKSMGDNSASCQGFQRIDINQAGSLLVAHSEQVITFWDIETGRMLFSGKNPLSALFILSPDWFYLAQVNWDNQNISLWGVQP